MRHFTARDGARIAFEEEGDGRPLLLLHGLMAHGGFFEPQSALADDFRLIRPDLRGHRDSPAGGVEPTIDIIAQDIAALADHLDLRSALVVGWSLGASVMWRLLVGPSSHRFSGAVVIDMTPRVLNEGDWTLGLSADVCESRRAAIEDDFESFAVAAGGAIFAQPLSDEARPLAAWAGREFARNDGTAIASLWRSLVAEDLRPLLGRIRQPTLVVHGAHSHLYGSDTADHLVGALPDARPVSFARSGHSPHLEQPEEFNAAIRRFAASLPPVLQPQTTA